MLRALLLFLGFAQELMYILARAPGRQMQGARAEGDVGAYRRGACNAAGACPPPRPEGLRPAGPEMMPFGRRHVTTDTFLARVGQGLRADSKMCSNSCASP